MGGGGGSLGRRGSGRGGGTIARAGPGDRSLGAAVLAARCGEVMDRRVLMYGKGFDTETP